MNNVYSSNVLIIRVKETIAFLSWQDVSFVMCLDSISSGPLTMHVSKPPKPGTPAQSIKSRLNVPIVHKKINLADELLAWHHERFSIRRMTAFTLSSLQVCIFFVYLTFAINVTSIDVILFLIALIFVCSFWLTKVTRALWPKYFLLSMYYNLKCDLTNFWTPPHHLSNNVTLCRPPYTPVWRIL